MVYARRNVALRDKVAVAAPLRAYRSAAKDDEALFIALDSCVWHLTSGTWHLPPATRPPPPPLRGPGTNGTRLRCFT